MKRGFNYYHNRPHSISMLFCLLFFITLSSASWQNTNEVFNVTANILEPTINIFVETPRIYLGDVTSGYKTHGYPITIVNRGTADIVVSPRFSSQEDTIFTDHLLFGTESCASTCKKVEEYNFTMDGESGSYVGEGNYDTKTFYTKLDLTDYDGELSALGNISTELTFWVMPSD
jgi:hypothetical protein